jgi:hypothetical protein
MKKTRGEAFWRLMEKFYGGTTVVGFLQKHGEAWRLTHVETDSWRLMEDGLIESHALRYAFLPF